MEAEEENKQPGGQKPGSSKNLGGLGIMKKNSSASSISQGSAIDDACSMEDHEDFLMGGNNAEAVFDNFASGMDLDATSHSSGGNEQNQNDVFEDTIMLKTKKKSCKTYWLQLLGIDAFFYKK